MELNIKSSSKFPTSASRQNFTSGLGKVSYLNLCLSQGRTTPDGTDFKLDWNLMLSESTPGGKGKSPESQVDLCSHLHCVLEERAVSNTSNFREAIRKAQGQALVGPNVIKNALPYVGGGLILTALGAFGGLGVLGKQPQHFHAHLLGGADCRNRFVLRGQHTAHRPAKGKNNQRRRCPCWPPKSVVERLPTPEWADCAAVLPTSAPAGVVSISPRQLDFSAGSLAGVCGHFIAPQDKLALTCPEEDGFALTRTIAMGIIALLVARGWVRFVFAYLRAAAAQFLDMPFPALVVLIFVRRPQTV